MCYLMACVRLPSAAAASPLASFRVSTLPPRFARPGIRLTKPLRRFASLAASTARAFDWDDVVRVAEEVREDEDPSDLRGYFEKVRLCNRGSDLQSEFVPFLVVDQIVGYVHNRFVDHLRQFEEVFKVNFGKNEAYTGGNVQLHYSLVTPEERTRAVGNAIKCLGGLIPGIRNELYPVKPSFEEPVFFSLERAAAPYFGIKAYGVHMNGYVEINGENFLWIGKRSISKQTFPGMLDHLVAGGLPHGMSCKENLQKECEEEAGIPRSLSNVATSVGAVSYMDMDGYSFKRDVLFCYDLKLPVDFIPKNEDGEVDSFRLVPVTQVANVIRRTKFFKPNCALVIIDFLCRHGYITPDEQGYLKLLQSLRSGDCS
ncbi:nudix hydrolase 20, chloroplastic-like [Zingiber officinale]|uniref:nudix hydrolase 20, chloroplastic-like n=1 Tax=Zingiber officinale TaxID=94328 RepID=UPI001C4B417F|nr:nudix hydrolase 20, chloroplastic-like [Zingiber officinale]XP_042388835.1 nudix hydrolase 20, chloroplastic-like [Zingiber officinale]